MADLRITGVTNNQLELQAPDGTRHYLTINDDLVQALRNREVSLPVEVTPRVIQQQIRLGSSVEEVAAATGADIDLVQRFAKPILAELNHIVVTARNIRLSLAGDRFADPTPVQFGDVMDERLSTNGARNVLWSSRKSEDGEWLVSISFETASGSGVATWSFDPKQLFLSPENEAALQLSNGVPISAVSKTVPLVTEIVEEPTVTSLHPSLSVVPEVVEVVETLEIEDVSQEEFEQPLFEEDPAPMSHPLRIVTDEDVQAATQSAPEQVEETDEPEIDESPTVRTQDAEKPTTNSRWAEVLFGTKEDEEEV